jgi:hypothetical protein
MNKRHAFLMPAMLLLAVSLSAQVYLVDYSVYFWPSATSPAQVEKTISNGHEYERLYAIAYNVGQTAGTHPYKLLLRVWSPGSATVACEATTLVQPWSGTYTMKKIAYFEAVYDFPRVKKRSTVKPGKYTLMAYLTEQVPSGQAVQDTDPGNNQYPFQNENLSVTVDVRAGAQEIRCNVVSRPVWSPLPTGFKVPAHP